MRRSVLLLLPAACLAFTALALRPPASEADGRPRRSLMDAPTRSAIERGIRFLVRTQNADGSWTCDAGNKVNDEYKVFDGGQNVHHVGVTALAVLAFLAAGHAPEQGPYGQVVERAVQFIVSRI